ncbi:hypothetical protein RIR_jg40420.t1 [Rhizophagus irregularis DAOM 181602=DAOM 197198]|nr:hypothetical protein RIR_jg40420.t1 [Rhizophagus irregularis DAOM 181602=DAOM 197198]
MDGVQSFFFRNLLVLIKIHSWLKLINWINLLQKSKKTRKLESKSRTGLNLIRIKCKWKINKKVYFSNAELENFCLPNYIAEQFSNDTTVK